MERIKKIALPNTFAVQTVRALEVNAYLLDGEPLTLVDTGPKMPQAAEALETALGKLGYRLADIAQILITHAHYDHFGLAATVRAASGAKVLASAVDAPALADQTQDGRARGRRFVPFLLRLGLPEDSLAPMRKPSAEMRGVLESVAVDVTLQDGDLVRAGGVDWRVIATPGHTPGHLCFCDSRSGVLIGGDHLLRDHRSHPFMEPPDETGRRPPMVAIYLESLRRTSRLDTSVVLPGHGKPLFDPKGTAAQRIAFHETRKEDVMALVDGTVQTPYQIGKRLFPQLAEGHMYLVLSEVVGHLDLLEEEGRVIVVENDGRFYYSARSAKL